MMVARPDEDEDPLMDAAQRRISALATRVCETAGSRIDDMTLLPPNFTPGPRDVVCARGKQAYNHTGNRRFRVVIEMNLERYSKATTKMEKSLIVSSIVDCIRQASPEGGFLREEGGRWYEAGDQAAREKVGQG